MEPSSDAWNISLKGGNMFLNRFCIDEDAAFELSGVYFLTKSFFGTWWPPDKEKKEMCISYIPLQYMI